MATPQHETADTVTEATRILEADGYDLQLDVRGGEVHFKRDGKWQPCGAPTADRIYRFEGTSNPADEMIVVAVSDGDLKGVLVSAYGPDTDLDTADALKALIDGR